MIMPRPLVRTPRVISCLHAVAVVAAAMVMPVHGFAPTTRISSGCGSQPTTAAASNQQQPWLPRPVPSSCLRSTNDDDGNEEARRLQDKAKQYRAEAEKLRLTLGLQKVDDLEKDIRAFMKGDDDDGGRAASKREQEALQGLKDRVEELIKGSLGTEEARAMLTELSSFASPAAPADARGAGGSKAAALTAEETKRAVAYLGTLPTPVKDTLAKAMGYSDYESVLNMEDFVLKLYLNDDTSMAELRRLYYQSFSTRLPAVEGGDTATKDGKEDDLLGLSKMIASTIENQTRAMDLFPRSVQDADEDILPTEADAKVVFELLDRSFMATEKPVKVDGGYIIRGVNKRKSASELLDFIDGKIAQNSPAWTDAFQVSLVEIYSDASDELFEDALLVTPNRFEPLAPKLLVVATTAVALFSSCVFCIDAFGDNPLVMEKLKSAVETAQDGGVYDISWFNALLIPLLATLGTAQGLHEAAHYAVAWSKQVKLTSPTVLPAQALPYLSFQNRLKTSPKGWPDLFDIAFVGPITGLSVSFLALLVGLQLTSQVDPETALLLPSLSVGYLTQSTLAGTIVDLVLGGGDGILLQQDAATQVPLHPVAIGGFLGLIIHALDLVPVGSTDGGRMSQAVLGRVWHLTFSSLVFLALFVASFTAASDSSLLLGFLLVYSFTQRDSEVPCRNEIDKAELPRAVAALVSWLLAALILVPLR